MKFFALFAIASVSAIKLEGPDWEAIKSTNEDEWITVPPQDVKVADPDWGHEVQRLGHPDWLDKSYRATHDILNAIPPIPDAEGRIAVADS